MQTNPGDFYIGGKLEDEIFEIAESWKDKAEAIAEVAIPLEQSDVDVAEIKLVWIPY